MRAMKDSGIEWIGEIPQEWRVSKVKHSYDVVLGKMLQTNQKSETDELLPYMCAANITWAGVDLSTEKQMWFSDSEKSLYLLKHGDLLVTEGGDVAVSCIWMDELPQCCIQNAVHRVRPIDNASNRFLYYWLYTLKNQGYFDLVCNKATLAHFTKEKLDSCFLIVPPTDEQERIASFLDTKCAEIDALIAAKEKTNALLKERRQSIIYEAVTKGLDPTAPMKDSGVEWIGEIPEGWNIIRAKYIATISNGSDPKEEGDIPVYGSGSDSFRTCGEYKEGPAVLIGRKGATLHIPHYVEGKYWNVDTAFDVKTDESKYLLKYYYYASICFDYKLYISTTTLPSMTQTNYGNMFLPLPSVEEQWEIIDHIEESLCTIDSLIGINETAVQKLKEYRQSLIYEAVTGKIEL